MAGVYFNGTRFSLDAKRGYYHSTKLRRYLHQAIWEFHNGPILKGFVIHHKDGNKANNVIENYELKTPGTHSKHHWNVDRDKMLALTRENIQKAQEAAPEWHRSEDGRAWHKQHGTEVQANLQPVEFVCEQCGTPYTSLPCGSHRFCSNNCRASHRRRSGVDDVSRSCERCGQEFMANRYSPVRHCSRSCGTTGVPRPKRHTRDFICYLCGAAYKAPWTGTNRFCSAKCRTIHGNALKKEQLALKKEKLDGQTEQ